MPPDAIHNKWPISCAACDGLAPILAAVGDYGWYCRGCLQAGVDAIDRLEAQTDGHDPT